MHSRVDSNCPTGAISANRDHDVIINIEYYIESTPTPPPLPQPAQHRYYSHLAVRALPHTCGEDIFKNRQKTAVGLLDADRCTCQSYSACSCLCSIHASLPIFPYFGHISWLPTTKHSIVLSWRMRWVLCFWRGSRCRRWRTTSLPWTWTWPSTQLSSWPISTTPGRSASRSSGTRPTTEGAEKHSRRYG